MPKKELDKTIVENAIRALTMTLIEQLHASAYMWRFRNVGLDHPYANTRNHRCVSEYLIKIRWLLPLGEKDSYMFAKEAYLAWVEQLYLDPEKDITEGELGKIAAGFISTTTPKMVKDWAKQWVSRLLSQQLHYVDEKEPVMRAYGDKPFDA
jgi:hypothetical protein